nr:MAG TPA: helix-turn-helix domain protein [Caudoviricetes sp.]
MSTRQEVYKLIIEKKDNKEIAATLNISVRSVQLYRKEYEKDLIKNESEIKNESKSEKKKRKEKAKVLIETGASLKEAATQSNTTIDIVKRLSSKEKLQVKQLDYLKSLREKYSKEIAQNKEDRFYINTEAKERIWQKLRDFGISKELQDTLKQNELTEQEILELNRLERLERFELEKSKYKNSLALELVEKIESMTDTDIIKVLEYIKELENNTDESNN